MEIRLCQSGGQSLARCLLDPEDAEEENEGTCVQETTEIDDMSEAGARDSNVSVSERNPPLGRPERKARQSLISFADLN